MALRVRTPFSVGHRVVGIGTEVDPDDPIVEGREHLFVEQATAAPGEVRNVVIPQHVCDDCGFKAKTGGGLASHRRACESD